MPGTETLIVAPHADDEVLGCFSHLKPGTFVLYLGIEDRSYVSRAGRIEEVEKAAEKTGFRWEALHHPVNRYDARDLIGDLEKRINELKPSAVFLPQLCYNQDHRAVYDAAVVALRPHDQNWFVPDVFLYEQPHMLTWRHHGELEPNYFCPVDIEEKIATYELYQTQVRGHRSSDILRAMARLRGAQAGVPAAEAFVVKRMVRKN
jgi:N-acetylglucosamine malate deacetylase 1